MHARHSFAATCSRNRCESMYVGQCLCVSVCFSLCACVFVCLWVMVEAGVLPVESTVDRLSTHVSVSVEVAVLSVDGIREWQWIGSAATCMRVSVLVEAAVFSVDGIREWQWIGIAATFVGVGGSSGAVSGTDSRSTLRPHVSVSVEAAVLSVDSIRKFDTHRCRHM